MMERGLGGNPAPLPLKPGTVGADSDGDSRLGTDGNQTRRWSWRERAADDAALLMRSAVERFRISSARECV
jgi:hypothetical protein